MVLSYHMISFKAEGLLGVIPEMRQRASRCRQGADKEERRICRDAIQAGDWPRGLLSAALEPGKDNQIYTLESQSGGRGEACWKTVTLEPKGGRVQIRQMPKPRRWTYMCSERVTEKSL